MAVIGVMYDNALLSVVKQTLNLETDALGILLGNSTYVFDPADDNITDIIAGGELENNIGTGYERKDIVTPVISLVAGNKVRFDCDDVAYTAIDTTTDILWGIIYLKGATEADRKLVIYLEGLSTQTNGSDIDFRIPATGAVEFQSVQPV